MNRAAIETVMNGEWQEKSWHTKPDEAQSPTRIDIRFCQGPFQLTASLCHNSPSFYILYRKGNGMDLVHFVHKRSRFQCNLNGFFPPLHSLSAQKVHKLNQKR